MRVAGAMARLLTAQGLVGILLAVLAHADDRPAVAWVLGFLGFVLLSSGMVMWVAVDNFESGAMREAEARGRQRFEDGRPSRDS